MASKQWRTAPDPEQTGWPSGVPYIIGNEGCERFSFYGMKSILQVHLTILFAIQMGLADSYDSASTFLEAGGELAKNAKEEAQVIVHLFIAGVYALPMIGAIIADRAWGKYNTIIWLSLVYCAGHGVLAVGENSLTGMYLGLGLIAIGSGGIKPCVSANVGDQFGKGNWHLMERVFQAFYWIINFGSFFATLMIPWLRNTYGNSVAFGVPGVLMLIATIVFWMGRDKFVHAPPRPGGRIGWMDTLSSTLLFLAVGHLFFTATLPWWQMLLVSVGFIAAGLLVFQARQRIEPDDGFLSVMFRWLKEGKDKTVAHFGAATVEGPVAVVRIVSIFVFVSVFWALFDQHASSWIRQGQQMDIDTNLFGWNFQMLPEQFQAANPLMVMLLIPFATFLLYPTITKLGYEMTALRRMSIGFVLAALAYVSVALLQITIEGSEAKTIHILWQGIPYFILTMGEVMISITGLEFAYTQAPPRMKSTIMGFWLLGVSLGSVFVAIITTVTKGMALSDFFWLWTAIGTGTALLFATRAYFYRVRDYTQ